METNYICFATLSTGSKRKLTQEDYNNFLEAEKDDYIQPTGGLEFKKSSVMEIQDISEFEEDKQYSYGQAYSQLPAGLGFEGLIKKTPNQGLEAMARGLKRYFDKNPNSPNALALLEKMRLWYAKKNNQKQMA